MLYCLNSISRLTRAPQDITRFLSAIFHLSRIIHIVCGGEIGQDLQTWLAPHDISEQDFCKLEMPECLRPFEYVAVQSSTKRNLIVRFEKVVSDARLY